MWLIISLLAAFVSSLIYFRLESLRQKLKLGSLALMLLGLAIMISVDRAIAFSEGEPFISFTTSGLIENSVVLGFAMVLSVLASWALCVFISRR